jgi:two-component system NtrC family sensor kinase
VFRAKVRAFLDLYHGRRELADARDALERTNLELRAAQDQLIEAAKSASRGVMIDGLTHEINNPLAYVMGHVSTISRVLSSVFSAPDGTASEAETAWPLVQERLRGIQLGLERIQTLVMQLRTFARLEPGKRQLLDVAECVQSALTALQPRLAGRIGVSTRFGEPSQIECDPQLLTQGILNLIANAVDAIEARGSIDIITGLEGPDYVIRIADNGTGIPESIRHRVVEPFFTTKPGGKGTGLGLAATHSMVTSQGGSLELRDLQEGGTEAILRIPQAASQ